ncbi:MAG: DUF5131 family protein [Candidatus Staskawiczbacteria bacterium]|jgi:protein gp37
MSKKNIEWTEESWNPVLGCKFNCAYCFARKQIGGRFKKSFEPRWVEGQYRKPYKIKKPSKIFVCSYAELFGDWIPKEWIEKVLRVAKDNPQHTFQFLTKNPKRYLEFEFSENCWLGTTVDYPNQERIDWLKKKNGYKFISFEPLLGDMSGLDISGIDLVIIGAMTRPCKIPPKKEWIESIRHPNIFYKDNIKEYLPKKQNDNR